MRLLVVMAILLFAGEVSAAECGAMAESLFEKEHFERTADIDGEAGKKFHQALIENYRQYYASGCAEEELNKFFDEKKEGFGPKSKKEITDGSAR